MSLVLCVSGLARGQTDDARQLAQHVAKSQRYLEQKKPDLAIPELRAILTLDPGNLNAHANLGVLLYFKGDYANAGPQLSEALHLHPGLWKVQALLGLSQKRTGDLNHAIMNLEAALPFLDDPKFHVDTGLELIEAAAASGLLDKAASVIGTLRQLDPANPLVLSAAYRIYSELTDEALLSMVAVAPDSAQMHMLMAHELVRQGNNAGALEQCRAALKIDPTLPGLHFEFAELLHDSVDPALQAQAEQQYKAALALNPFDRKAASALGRVAASHGDLQEAKRYYTRALQVQPDNAETKTDLGRVLLTLRENQQALALLQAAVQLDPTNADAHFSLSTLFRQIGKPAEAKHELDEYRRYKELKEKLGKTFHEMRGQTTLTEVE